jgi:hypothetical protein
MYTQSRTKTVPYGFICGFPIGGVSSELYGYYEGQGGRGGRQGAAVVEAMNVWGEGEAGTAGGTELGFAVCKRGYKPFGHGGERMFGCARHSPLRLETMQRGLPLAAPDKKGRGKGSTADLAAAAAAQAAATASAAAGGGSGSADGRGTGGGGAHALYHRPGWERFDQWIFGEKISVSSTSDESNEEGDEEEDEVGFGEDEEDDEDEASDAAHAPASTATAIATTA